MKALFLLATANVDPCDEEKSVVFANDTRAIGCEIGHSCNRVGIMYGRRGPLSHCWIDRLAMTTGLGKIQSPGVNLRLSVAKPQPRHGCI